MTNAQIYVAGQPLLRPFVVLIFALVSVRVYSIHDPYILDSDDLFAEVKEWSTVAIVIFSIINQMYAQLDTKIQAGSNIMLTAALMVVFGVFAYFCLKSIGTEVSFFTSMFTRLFPRTTEMIKKWSTDTKDPTVDESDSDLTSVVEEHSDSNQESTGCKETTGNAGLEMVPIQSEFYFPTFSEPGNETFETGFEMEI
uniref:Uncharacterized protein n=1 Tax=Octactis speculum TaxID=3111310 RepID=A0A7S2HAK5_9STRA